MRPRPGQEIEVDIDRAAMEGRGVGRFGDLVVFVERGLPGERVRAEVVRSKKSFVEARAIEVLRASAARVPGRCVHLGTCGGCSWQELAYEAQLAAKTDLVRESLERLGHLVGVDVPPAIASPRPFH
jgi:23S rRNA (uracil1939-C5)-methyltransferase